MLLEPRQCALFDHAVLANSMSWNRAPLSRIRVYSENQPYRERVIQNGDGDLLRIDRDYRNLKSRSTRVLMTRRASVAQIWPTAKSVEEPGPISDDNVDWTPHRSLFDQGTHLDLRNPRFGSRVDEGAHQDPA